jgi:hypothetical protein
VDTHDGLERFYCSIAVVAVAVVVGVVGVDVAVAQGRRWDEGWAVEASAA